MLSPNFSKSPLSVNLADIILTLPGYVFLKDKASRYIDCNDRAAKLCGLRNPKDISGKTDYDLAWNKELAKQFITEDQKIITDKKPITQEYKLPIKREDNQYISIRSEKIPLYDSEREVIGILIISTDITEKKLGELTSLETLIDYLPCNVYWMNPDTTMARCNRNVLDMLGMSSLDEFVGKTYEEITQFARWPEKLSQKLKNDDLQVLKTGQPLVNVEDPPIPHANGVDQYLLTNRVPIKNKSGQVIGIAGISVDITELKETQSKLEISLKKAEVANQAKTAFLENMRHDIRTPLSGIVGCSHLIKMQSGLPPKVIAFADDLVLSSEALLGFLSKILESITVSSGEIPLLRKEFNLKKDLEEIVRLNKPQAVLKGLELSLDYDETIPTYLYGDGVRAQRIILELLTNALKYTDKGFIKVSTHLMKNEKHEAIIELRVSDSGMGIPQDKHKEVYDRFTRLTPSYQGIYPGTGLGLSVVKQFIEDLNGEIQIESEVGKGTTFICVIPFQESSVLPKERTTNEPLAVEVVNANGSHVLVVEDNTIAVKVAKNVLSELDCRTDVANDGKTALEKIEKNHYDLILMDIGLPDNDGCEVTRRIRLKQWQKNPSVPIIGFTAHIDEEKKQSCLANGMNAVFNKPLTLEKAAEILDAFISQQHPSQKATPKSTGSLQSTSILNIDHAIKLIGNKAVIRDCLDLLVSGLSKELEIIKQQHKEKDWVGIRNMAHKWKGGASYCGASRLEQACEQLATALQTNSLEEAEVLYQQLIQVAEETKEAAKKAITEVS